MSNIYNAKVLLVSFIVLFTLPKASSANTFSLHPFKQYSTVVERINGLLHSFTDHSNHVYGDDDDDGYNGGYNGGSNYGDDDDGYYGGGGHTHNWWCWWYGCNYDDNGGNDIPLDGGLSFLAIAGAGLGLKKAIERKNKSKS